MRIRRCKLFFDGKIFFFHFKKNYFISIFLMYRLLFLLLVFFISSLQYSFRNFMLNFTAAYLWRLRPLKCFNFALLIAFNKFFMCNEHFIVIKFQIHLYIKIYTLKSWRNFTLACSPKVLRTKIDSKSHFDTFVLVAFLLQSFPEVKGILQIL